jgi:hypothetical protein
MPAADRLLGMYLHLARASMLRRQPLVRDRMLVLAGATAAEMGLPAVSATCRQRVLEHNGQHMLREWTTLDEALDDERFQNYLRGLRRRYSPEKAEHMLQTLGVEWVNERAAYYTDEEYATALLAATPAAVPPAALGDVSSGRPWTPSPRRWLWAVMWLVALGAAAAWFWLRRG